MGPSSLRIPSFPHPTKVSEASFWSLVLELSTVAPNIGTGHRFSPSAGGGPGLPEGGSGHSVDWAQAISYQHSPGSGRKDHCLYTSHGQA